VVTRDMPHCIILILIGIASRKRVNQAHWRSRMAAMPRRSYSDIVGLPMVAKMIVLVQSMDG
jgi:hypothetical protein